MPQHGHDLAPTIYKRQINPSGHRQRIALASSLFHVTNDLTLTIDPSVQYVLAEWVAPSTPRSA